jgi:V/A-type H+/Na+-transporting ATPase subunit E
MSQPDKKLDKFTSAVLSDAQARRAKILAEIEDYRKAEMEKAEEDILHEAYIMIQNEISAIKNRQSKTVSLAELEGRRKFLRQREDIMGKVFSEASARVLEYAKTPEYADKLCADVGASCAEMPEGALVIRLRHDDMPYADRLAAASGRGAGVEEDSSIALGGFILVNNDKGVIVDNTLDLKLASQKEWFASSSGLGMGL